jgi:hypothetical protein
MRFFNGIIFCLPVLFFVSCETLDMNKIFSMQNSAQLSENKITGALKQALEKGVTSAVDKLSSKNGFTRSRKYRIPTPEKIKPVTDTLRKIGLTSLADSFENKMNSAAEKATAAAAPVFLDAIMQMTFQDARTILYGKNTEAADYLKKHTYKKLLAEYKPIIRKSINETGAGRIYSTLMDKYDALPFKSKPDFSLENYVTEKSLDAIFQEIAAEEKLIRKDPKARTTQLLKEVFGNIK